MPITYIGMKFKFARKCISVGVCASISFSAPIPSQAMDAFDGAMSSMLMKKEKSVVERNFDALVHSILFAFTLKKINFVVHIL
jgi:hypothetical protein